MSKQILFQFILLLGIQNSILAQWSLRTDIVVPIQSTFNSNNHGIGTNISAEFLATTKSLLKVGFIHNTQIIADNMPDYTAEYSETSYDIIHKTGLRVGYKLYYRSQPENTLPKGLYIAAFTDAMHGHRILTKRIYSQETGYNQNVPIDKSGIFLGSGIAAGYTFAFGHLIVEPNIGIGLCLNPKSFYNNDSNNFFSELAPLPLHLSVWHLELNLGWAFE